MIEDKAYYADEPLMKTGYYTESIESCNDCDYLADDSYCILPDDRVCPYLD